MSQENVEVVRRTNEPLQGVDVAPSIRAALEGNTGAIPPQVAAGFAAWLNLFDPDVEIDTSRVDMPGFGLLRGLDGIRELFGRWIEEWEHYSWIHSNFSDAGEHVILDAEIHATGTSSGVEVVWNQSQTYTFREGKVIRWCIFNDRASALTATEHPQPRAAMAQENVEIVRSLYTAFSELAEGGDITSFVIAHFEPDCEYRPVEEEEAIRGHDALVGWIERWFEAWDEFRVDVDELIEADDDVIFAALTVHGHGAGSGIQVNQRFFHVWDLRGGKGLRQREYLEREEALEAVGLSE
jgi:ketosteroid isomerase-like protein